MSLCPVFTDFSKKANTIKCNSMCPSVPEDCAIRSELDSSGCAASAVVRQFTLLCAISPNWSTHSPLQSIVLQVLLWRDSSRCTAAFAVAGQFTLYCRFCCGGTVHVVLQVLLWRDSSRCTAGFAVAGQFTLYCRFCCGGTVHVVLQVLLWRDSSRCTAVAGQLVHVVLQVLQ